MQEVVEYQEEARHGGLRSHRALTYDHGRAVGTGAKRELPPGQALTYDHSGAIGTHSLRFSRLRSGQAVQAWTKSELPPGQALRQPAPLFKKLDERVVEEEYAQLEG
jgi:hypothetical protein